MGSQLFDSIEAFAGAGRSGGPEAKYEYALAYLGHAIIGCV
jgi:hypothetical protein